MLHVVIIEVQESPEPFPEERAALDKDIMRHELIICDLKSQRNALSRICQLPPEILSQIFLLHAQRASPSKHIYAIIKMDWTKITHVCRHFRSVALGCPSLWSEIVFTSRSWTTAMLALSKSADLTLKVIRPFDSALHQCTQLALAQMHRVRSLSITEANPTSLNMLLGDLESAAPKLQSLRIESSSSYSSSFRFPHLQTTGMDRALYSGLYRLPRKFLAGGTPRLSTLELLNCSVLWDSSLFSPSMTNLSITASAYAMNNGPTLSELLDALARMPNLQTVELHGTLPTVPDTLQELCPSDRVEALPRLHSITLKGTIIGCINVLNSLSIPEKTKLRVWGEVFTAACFEISALMRAILKSRGSPIQPRTLQIDRLLGSPTSAMVKSWDVALPGGASLHEAAEFELDLYSRLHNENVRSYFPDDVLDSLFKGFDLNKLVDFGVKNTEAFSQNMWTKHFGSLPMLSHIRLLEHGGDTLLDSMKPSVEVGTLERVHSSLLFRPLVSLTLDDVDFGEIDIADSVIDTLALRAEYGAPLQKLKLFDSRKITGEEIALLEEVVGEFVWDGIIQDDDEEEDYDYEESLGRHEYSDEDFIYGSDYGASWY